jgi:hypothetical protein
MIRRQHKQKLKQNQYAFPYFPILKLVFELGYFVVKWVL